MTRATFVYRPPASDKKPALIFDPEALAWQDGYLLGMIKPGEPPIFHPAPDAPMIAAELVELAAWMLNRE